MLKKILGKFSHDLGIDLGTANTLIYVKSRGIVLNEPSVVAVNNVTGQILAVGEDARKMVGKTPRHITATKPLAQGIISDFEVAEKMLKFLINKVHQDSGLIKPRPRVIISIPLEITEVERKAVSDAAVSAGAREVILIEEPMAAAVGARLPIQEAAANMIVDIGGGTTEIAVISLGGIVTWKSLKVAGNNMDLDIINTVREQFNLLLGERTAEAVKKQIGSAFPLAEPLSMKVRGRDLISGLPKEITITDQHIRQALSRSTRIILENIKSTIEVTPPELVGEIFERGIILTGGGALLKGLADFITQETHITATVTDDPLTTVARGTGIILDSYDELKQLTLAG